LFSINFFNKILIGYIDRYFLISSHSLRQIQNPIWSLLQASRLFLYIVHRLCSVYNKSMNLILLLKKSKDLRLVLAMLLLALAFYVAASLTGERAKECERKGGTWLKKYKECENVSFGECLEMAGFYNFCASPCRHNEEENIAEMCTFPCIKVCEFIRLKK